MAPAESHRAALSFPSGNAKTGPIAVSSTSRLTCPSSCSLAGEQGCYAEAGFRTRLHWDRLSAGRLGSTASAFIQPVAALPAGVMFPALHWVLKFSLGMPCLHQGPLMPGALSRHVLSQRLLIWDDSQKTAGFSPAARSTWPVHRLPGRS